ncbi:MAG: hypothetical protein KBA86_01625 [Bacteroidales bacterium]|nr:hypothetical protein [Bacteroidales bacterium]
MYNKRILFLFISISNLVYAQNGSWTIGFNTGLRGEVMQGSEKHRLYKFGSQVSSPPLELNCFYGLTNQLSVGLGIGYIEHYARWKSHGYPYYFNINQNGFGNYNYLMYKSLQIPLSIKWDIPLFNSKFGLISTIGLTFDIPISKLPIMFNSTLQSNIIYEETDCIFTQFHTFYPYNKKINYILKTGFGCICHFKNGMNISLTGEYHVGTRLMQEVNVVEYLTIKANNKIIEPYEDRLLDYGSYWNISLGISYTFQKNKF